MRIVIAGGHGQIALRLSRLLSARGDEPVGLIRQAGQVGDVRATGAQPALLDLETATVAEVAEVAEVRARPDLDWTVLRPGGLRNEPGTGRVLLAEKTGRGPVSRDDVAAVLAALLAAPGTAGRTLELSAGDTPVAEAVAAFAT